MINDVDIYSPQLWSQFYDNKSFVHIFAGRCKFAGDV